MRRHYDFGHGNRGAVVASPGKTRITIMLDNDVIEHFRNIAESAGTGYQTMINAVLRATLVSPPDNEAPLTESRLREILHEELAAAIAGNVTPVRRA